MSLLNDVTTGIQIPSIKINLSGTDGIGKTTFASQAPNPIFIKTESGTNYVDTSSFPLCESYDDILMQIKTLYEEDHNYKTVVFDTTDWAEKLVQQKVCANHNLKSIESINILQIVNSILNAPSRSKNILDKNLNIVLEISKKSLLMAEKILLEQAIGNIVNNALDFSPKSGTITIKVSETNTAISIIVLDDGPGIPPHVLSKLFTRFFSVSRPDTGVRGNGLGLRFVRKIMQLHGGEVTLQNRFIQQGAEAKLRFPINTK